jgi:ornithine cyclodeaminase
MKPKMSNSMQVLVVNHHEVQQLLSMKECMDVMAETFKMLNRGNVHNPLRTVTWLPDKSGLMAMMPTHLGEADVMGLKAISVFPGNHATEYDSHQGVVLLFEIKNGRLLAIMDAGKITAIRTAAVSGVATKMLAGEHAGNLAILGSGVQAATHLEAMQIARDIKHVRVWSRNPDHAREFAEKQSVRCAVSIEAVDSARRAAEEADIICTVTSATDPVLQGEWIAPGTHINAVGSSVAFARELDTAAVVKSKLFVDRRQSTLNEAGDFLFPKKEGAVDDDHIRGEIGDILLGRIEGRTSVKDTTLFKSLGLAAEDAAAALFIYRKLAEKGSGLWIELGATKTA